MKNIKLTEKHKKQLLEMTNKLFSEHQWSFSSDLADEGMLDWDIDKKERGLIHWFEFCMTHLIIKLSQNINQTDHDYELLLSNCFINNKTHPIDYLYSQYKRFKINEK